ncbi:exopolysaccharide biosynthesis polyprenyl glycosylphosphotransferase [Nocardioides sp.]|uniref:exopolysaccharide biosynthesis polyprenyl glycosylphosphotransferase n=1 Tax=Nocardioides sp. TaxID=35761 RepID=UPI0031FEC957|nr:Exopolysaccharide biosynthesis polyprenyl glycosylphosphotransferase [Nocardioides sp.]
MAEALAPAAPHPFADAGQVLDAGVAAPLRRLGRISALRWHPHAAMGDVLAACVTLSVLGLQGASLGRQPGLALLLGWPLLLAARGAYARGQLLDDSSSAVRRVVHSGMVLGLVCWVGSAFLNAPASGTLIAFTGCVTAAGVALRLVPQATRRTGTRSATAARVVLVGHPVDVRRALAELERPAAQRVQVVAVCLTQPGRVDDLPPSAVGGVDTAAALAIDQSADAVLVLPGHLLDPGSVRRLQWRLEAADIEIYLGTGLVDVAPFRRTNAIAAGLVLVHVAPAPLHGLRRFLKDVAERSAAALVLVAVAPVLVTIALLIRRGSPGGAIFRQERVGLQGRTFTMYKFRTMGVTAESMLAGLADSNETGGVLFKLRQDPRVTELGHFLRRYSLDEMPQLWNVVRGDMALVGPRPALPSEVAEYDVDPRRRLVVKPGLTGLWQVSGRSDLSWEDTVRLDTRYVDNWSPGLDLAIVLRTLRAVLDHRGAY